MSDEPNPTVPGNTARLKKQLGLWDVYAISTGAMFSSGFFLLPGLATAYAGPSTVIAYLIAGLLVVPAMLCMAELSTALPRAGGAYYFIDRSMGPAVGTIGGFGVWLSLILKSGFALLGMGAYLAIAPGLSQWLPQNPDHQLWVIKSLAVALTVVFTAVNIWGAKEGSRLQSALVIALLGILAFFVVQGVWYMFFRIPPDQLAASYTPFLHEANGWQGTLSTVGLVFVSYAGLTNVASVSEEVKRPERNLPLGMILSLITATTIYVVGVAIMVATVDPETLRHDYTPVATAADSFFRWLPVPIGLILVITAALCAFASTANAGILSASRYPLGMSRDGLISERIKHIGRYNTPTVAVLLTSGLMILFVLLLSAEGVAKLASSFNLLVFGMISLAVIVMRESRIESYDPGFRCPLYPWTPLGALLVSVVLTIQMGWLPALFSLGVILFGGVWYVLYARSRVTRTGAIYHVFARLGRLRFEGLDQEFREIIKEKGLRRDDPFDDVVARASVIDTESGVSFESIVQQVADILDDQLPLSKAEIRRHFLTAGSEGRTPIANGLALPHFRVEGLTQSELVLVRSRRGIPIDIRDNPTAPPATDEDSPNAVRVNAIFFLVSPEENPGLHLRILSQIAGRMEQHDFRDAWLEAEDDATLRETLLRDERFIALTLAPDSPSESLIGCTLAELRFPDDTLVTLVRRENESIVPHGRTRLCAGDRVTIIGEPEGIAELYRRYKPRAGQAQHPSS